MSYEIVIVNYLVMLLFIAIQSYFYFKVSPHDKIRMPVMVSITTFSMILTPMLMSPMGVDLDVSMIGTPYIQLFFLLYQVLLFFFSIWEYRLIKSG